MVKSLCKTFPYSSLADSPCYLLKIKMDGRYRIFYTLCLVSCLTSCSSEHRLLRLLKNHPLLYETFRYDSIRVKTALVQDSIFFFHKEKDTLYFNNATIYRNSDTIRLRQSCPPCTTYITKQILQPTQKYIKEKGYKRSLREKLEDAIFPIIIGILFGFIVTRK